MRYLQSFLRDQSGIQHAEEALLLGLIVLAAITAAQSLSTQITASFEGAASAIPATGN